MKRNTNPELTQTINRQAHMLGLLSAASIRHSLEDKARAMLKAGKSLEDTLAAVRAFGLGDVGSSR